jgi:hypothetical protein
LPILSLGPLAKVLVIVGSIPIGRGQLLSFVASANKFRWSIEPGGNGCLRSWSSRARLDNI